MIGVLVLRKPSGITSRDAVNQVQRLAEPHKAGHAGTLDPLAEGVLVVCVGAATRLVRFVQQLPKTYRAEFELGCDSDTLDSEGRVSRRESPRLPSLDEVRETLPQFQGVVHQVPPDHSAVKVAGRRAYRLARQGAKLQLEPRPVRIDSLGLLDYEPPRLRLDVRCGAGTYIRSLGRDLGEAWQCGAVMTALTRKAIGHFTLENAVELSALESTDLSSLLLPPAAATAELPQLTVDSQQLDRLRNGLPIAGAGLAEGAEHAVIGPDGQLAGVAEVRQGELHPKINLA